MKTEVRKMLENVYGLISGKHNDPIKAWDSFIEFLAVDNCPPMFNQLDHKFEWLFEDKDFADEIIKTYDVGLLKSDYYDHLGEMYLEKIVSKNEATRKGQFLTPMNIADAMAEMTIRKTENAVKILDPAVGTGRLLMAAHKRAPKGLLFGVDIDLRALRVAFTNFAIHNISGYLLNADSLYHETDISTEEGAYNWKYANKWYSCMDKLKPINKVYVSRSNQGGQANLFEK